MQASDLSTPSRGIRVPRGRRQSLLERCRPYTSLTPDSCICFATAAMIHGISLPDTAGAWSRLHLARRTGTSAPRRRHVTGHLLKVAAEDVVMLDGVPVTSVARTFLDLSRVLEFDDAVAAGDSIVCAHRRGYISDKHALLSHGALRVYLDSRSGTHGIAPARKVFAEVEVGVDSPPETKIRLWLHRAGLPRFVPNQPILDILGNPTVWSDLGCERFRVSIQYDGGHHLTVRQQSLDAQRNYTTAQAGWLQVTLNRDDLRLGAAWIVGRVSEALRSRGWES